MPIPAAQQFAAIAYLRYRLFSNSFRRKGGAGELIARILIYPIGALFVIGPSLAAGFGAWAAVHSAHVDILGIIFWAIFILQIVVSINISAPGLSFDPESLIRFPLSFPRYLTVRLFLGLLSASTVIGTVALFSAALGTSIANPGLALTAFAAAAALALTNMLLIRMIFAWVDRWLSTRRAREALTALIILGSVGIQYLNVTFNNVGRHADPAAQARKIAAVSHFYHSAQPILLRLPPGLASAAILSTSLHAPTLALIQILGVLLFAALFLAVFAWRMQREYRGENLSETAGTPTAPTQPHAPRPTLATPAYPQPATNSFLSPTIEACLQKEFIYLRRNTSQFYGLLLPLAMVFLFSARLGHLSQTGLVFPAAVAYSLLGLSAISYNILGLDATGIQQYFLAPIHMRTVVLSKNLFAFAAVLLQVTLVYLLLLFTSGRPPLLITLITLSWLLFASFTNATVGNIRSLSAPKKMDPAKVSRRQASGLSGLISVGLILVIAAIGAGLYLLGNLLAIPWLPIPMLLALAAGAYALYMAGLNRVDAITYKNRESILEELCKAS